MADKNFIIPLYQFRLHNIDEIDLGDAKIFMLEDGDLNKIKENLYRKNKIIVQDLPKYFLNFRQVKGEEPRRTMDKMLIILKLFKSGTITSNLILDDGYNFIDHLPHYMLWKRPSLSLYTFGLPPLFGPHEELESV